MQNIVMILSKPREAGGKRRERLAEAKSGESICKRQRLVSWPSSLWKVSIPRIGVSGVWFLGFWDLGIFDRGSCYSFHG
jgi:hypothetical protein